MMLDGDYGEVPQTLKGPIDTIFQSSQSLAVIVEDFLSVSRIEQGKMKYDFTNFDLCALVNEVISENKPSVEKKGLVVSATVCPESVNVHGDRGKLKQVIGNLLDNSVKYTQKGSITVSLSSNKEKRKAVLTIKDTGVGIKPETIPYLFQKFSRAEDASKFNILGTGLGLYVAKEMIKANGGKVWVESPGEGKGATFFVEFPTI
jgi:signal transduction histidine kinase